MRDLGSRQRGRGGKPLHGSSRTFISSQPFSDICTYIHTCIINYVRHCGLLRQRWASNPESLQNTRCSLFEALFLQDYVASSLVFRRWLATRRPAHTCVLLPPPFWREQDAPERAGDPAKRVARKKKPSALDVVTQIPCSVDGYSLQGGAVGGRRSGWA